MITIVKQPSAGELFRDSENIEIRLKTDNEKTVLKATININGELYDNQVWPKYDFENAIVNLQQLVRSFPIKTTNVAPGIDKINSVFDVNIGVDELLNEGVVLDTKYFNSLKIIHSINNLEDVRYMGDLKFLGCSENLTTSLHSNITVPFYVKNAKYAKVTITDQNANIYYNVTAENLDGYYVVGKEVYLDYYVEYLFIQIKTPINTITKKVRVIKNSMYKPINIRFINQFGALIYTQFFGALESKDDYTNSVYVNQKSELFNADIQVKTNLTVNTGYLFEDEKFIVEQLLNSLNVEININNKYIPVVASTKSVKTFKSNQWVTSNVLTFTYNKYAAN